MYEVFEYLKIPESKNVREQNTRNAIDLHSKTPTSKTHMHIDKHTDKQTNTNQQTRKPIKKIQAQVK